MKEPNVTCDYCGKPFFKWPCYLRRTKFNFCCPQCCYDFSNKKKNPEGYSTFRDFTRCSLLLKKRNAEHNPAKQASVREKMHASQLNRGEGKTYRKNYGRHEHRVVAEQMLGRPLRPGEVIHHIDGDKRNNDPNNIFVFPSQAEHARYHSELKWFLRELEREKGI